MDPLHQPALRRSLLLGVALAWLLAVAAPPPAAGAAPTPPGPAAPGGIEAGPIYRVRPPSCS